MRTRAIFLQALMLAASALCCAAGSAADGAAATAAAGSASAPVVDSQDKISAARNAAKARFAAQERECRQHFIVTACVDAAKRERRDELDRLRVRQLAVDEARRRERAQTRRAELATKAAEDAKRETDRADRPPASGPTPRGRLVPMGRPTAAAAASASASGIKPRTRTAGDAMGIKPHVPGAPEMRRAKEEEKRAAFEARQKRAVEHRDSAQTQAVRRMADKPPGRPLPVPGSASSVLRPASAASPVAPL